MTNKSCRMVACASVFVSVAAIAHPSDNRLPAWPAAAQTPEWDPTEASTIVESVDEYKYYAAKQVMRANPAHTFSGNLPHMLPAVVVLRVTVDEDGGIADVWVLRKPAHDDGESEIAMASVYRAGFLPRPFNLATSRWRTLEYSETFLFNRNKQFQIRSLAPLQTAY